MTDIKTILNNPPSTWKRYQQTNDYWGIVAMELLEVKSAIKNYNISPDKIQDAIKELGHVAAALLNMRIELEIKKCAQVKGK